MSKFRALVASSLLATTLVGGLLATNGTAEAQAPVTNGRDSSWCC